MKRIWILLLALFGATANAQELMIDSIAPGTMGAVGTAGMMGEVIYIPYFSGSKNAKKNFLIKRINSQNLTEDGTTALEIPKSYKYVASTFNGMSFLLSFYDESKKESVVMLCDAEGNVLNKKSYKTDAIIPYTAGGGMENFLMMQPLKSGGYKMEMINDSFKTQWSKSYTPESGNKWEIVEVQARMDKLAVIRKQTNSAGKYKFVMHGIQPETGDNAFLNEMTTQNINPYPTFITENEGMAFSGGFYYKDGVYSNQKPDGIFFSMLTPEGTLNQTVKAPYSQLIEDLKESYGDHFSKNNAGIYFLGGTMLHELPGFMMTGQLYTRKDNNDGTSTVFTAKDLVMVRFNLEGEYKGADAYETGEQKATVNGNIAKVSDLELAHWLNQRGFFGLKQIVNGPGTPALAYINKQSEGIDQMCYRKPKRTVKSEWISNPHCVDIDRAPDPNRKLTYNYSANDLTPPVLTRGIIPGHMEEPMVAYSLNKNALMIWKVPGPPVEMEEEPPTEPEDIHEPEDPEQIHEGEEPPAEGENEPPQKNSTAEIID